MNSFLNDIFNNSAAPENVKDGFCKAYLSDPLFGEGVYIGEFVGGLPDGVGTFYCADETVFKGQFAKGERTGFGRLSFPGGAFPEECEEDDGGEDFFYRDLLSSPGAFLWEQAESGLFAYDGDFFRGAISGNGRIYYYDSRVIYSGDVFNATPEGSGKLTLRGGFSAEGSFRRGDPQKIILRYPDGKIYDGEFRGLIPEGKGVLSFPDGTVATGTFKDGKMIYGAVTGKDGAHAFDPHSDKTVNGVCVCDFI